MWKLGAVLLPLCTGYTKEEMLHCVQAADIDVIVADGEYLETLRRFELPVKILPLRTLTENLSPPTEKVERSEARCEDMDTILFTSGSTGKAKPVCTNHLARVNTMFAQAAALDADETDIFCMALPMYHCFSLTAMALAAVAVGACLCFPPDRKGRTILRTIEKERCTVLTAVPTLFSVLLKRYREEPCDLSSLQTGMIGGSTYSPQLYQEICRTFDFTLLPSGTDRGLGGHHKLCHRRSTGTAADDGGALFSRRSRAVSARCGRGDPAARRGGRDLCTRRFGHAGVLPHAGGHEGGH